MINFMPQTKDDACKEQQPQTVNKGQPLKCTSPDGKTVHICMDSAAYNKDPSIACEWPKAATTTASSAQNPSSRLFILKKDAYQHKMPAHPVKPIHAARRNTQTVMRPIQ
jgi:hypothetical protein